MNNARAIQVSLVIQKLNSGHFERSFLSLARGLKDRGYQVNFILYNRSGELLEQIESEFTVHSLPPRSWFQKFFVYWQLKALLKKVQPDLVIGLNNGPSAVLSLIRGYGKLGIPTIARLEGDLTLEIRHSGIFHKKFVPFFFRRSLRFADRVIGISRISAENLGTLAHLRVADIDLIESLVEVPQAEQPCPTNDGTKRVLISGCQMDRRQLRDLADALSRIGSKANVEFVLFTNPNGAAEWDQSTPSQQLRVSFETDEGRATGLLKNSDLFVSFELTEARSTLFLQALKQKLPVICLAENNLLAELLGFGQFGLVLDPEGEVTIDQAILMQLQDPITYGEEATARFDSDRIFARWAELIDRVATVQTLERHRDDVRPNVSIIINDFYGGGAELYAVRLANGLHKQGFPVEVVSSLPHGPVISSLSKEVPHFTLGKAFPGNVLRLRKYLKLRSPAVAISQLHQANVALLMSTLRYRNRPVTAVTIHNSIIAERDNPGSKKQRMMFFFAKFFYPSADYLLGVSNGVLSDLKRALPIDPSRLRHVPLILREDIQDQLDLEPKHAWLRQYKQGAGQPVLLGMGRLTKVKNFQLLLRAVAKVLENVDVRLIIYGDGEERSHLVKLAFELGIEQKVAFPGFISTPYVEVAHARLFVLSSNNEGFPTVLLEALACGTPVVSTNCPHGPAEMLDEGRFGALVQMNDVDALAKAILKELALAKQKPPAESYSYCLHHHAIETHLKLIHEITETSKGVSPTKPIKLNGEYS